MNILFHLLTVDPEHDAVAKRTLGTAELLAELGHTVYVVSNLPDYINGKKRKRWMFSFRHHEEKNGVHYQMYYTIPFFYKGTIRRLLNYYSFSFSSRFAKIKNTKIDVVVATEPPLICCKAAVCLAKKFKAKLVLDIQDIWPDVAIEMNAFSKNSFKAKSFNKIARYMYKRSDLIVTVSNNKVKKLDAKLLEYGKNTTFVPNATDRFFINQDFDDAFLEKYRFNKYFSCVHVGKVGKAQDLDSFLELAKHYLSNEKVRFYLLGDGVMMQHILKRIENEKIFNVIYCGVCNSQQCYTALANSKLSYVSLINKNLIDSVPTKLFESIYSGCPCLVCANGESAEIVDSLKFGMSCNAGDKNEMIKNFDFIYHNYTEIEKYRESAFRFIDENYERHNVTKKFENVLNNLIKKND